jgi:RimJ/RimL family protein N-acetyltransferase
MIATSRFLSEDEPMLYWAAVSPDEAPIEHSGGVMPITIQVANPQTDLERIAELTNAVHPTWTTVEQLRDALARQAEGHFLLDLVARTPLEAVAGFAFVQHGSWLPQGRFWLWLTTEERWRGQGIGTALYEQALATAQEQGATSLASRVRDDDSASLAFAQRRGFVIERHLFESVVDLTAFDEVPFAGVVAAVEASGIRFRTLADLGNTRDALRKLWELNYRVVLDDPASTGTFTSFEDFSTMVAGASWFDPHGQILALDGDAFVGLGAVGYFSQSRSASNMITGVARAYRGRHIALALKLLGIRYARAKGALAIRTGNDSQNAPMLAINRKLGYRPEPGIYRLLSAPPITRE